MVKRDKRNVSVSSINLWTRHSKGMSLGGFNFEGITKVYKYYCITLLMREVLTFRGDRDLWIDFIAKVKKNRKQVWEVLEKFIRSYIKR